MEAIACVYQLCSRERLRGLQGRLSSLSGYLWLASGCASQAASQRAPPAAGSQQSRLQLSAVYFAAAAPMAPRQRQLCEAPAAAVFAALRLRLSSAKLNQCLSDPGGGLFYDAKKLGSVAGLMDEIEAHAGLLSDLLSLGVLNKIVLQTAVKELNEHHGGKLMPSCAVSSEWVRFQACGLKVMLMKVRKVSSSASDGSRLPRFLKELVAAHRKCVHPEDESQGSPPAVSSATSAPLALKDVASDRRGPGRSLSAERSKVVTDAPVWQMYGLSPPRAARGVEFEYEQVMSSAPDSQSPGYSGSPLRGANEMLGVSLEGDSSSARQNLGAEPPQKLEPPFGSKPVMYMDWGQGRMVRLGPAGVVTSEMTDGPAGFQTATFADGEVVATELPNLVGQRPLPGLTKRKEAKKRPSACLKKPSARVCKVASDKAASAADAGSSDDRENGDGEREEEEREDASGQEEAGGERRASSEERAAPSLCCPEFPAAGAPPLQRPVGLSRAPIVMSAGKLNLTTGTLQSYITLQAPGQSSKKRLTGFSRTQAAAAGQTHQALCLTLFHRAALAGDALSQELAVRMRDRMLDCSAAGEDVD
jgi:hypothetical protein